MERRSQQPNAPKAQDCWLLVCDGAVGKWLNPVPLKGNSFAGYVGSNPTSASKKGANDAASIAGNTSRTNHNP